MQRWNLPEGWVISSRPAHRALVSEADFIAAQDISVARGPAATADMVVPEKRRYLLAGLLACGMCGRPKNAYIREDRTRRGADVRHPVSDQEVTGYLRDRGITLTYDPAAGTLQSGTCEAAKTTIRKAG